MRNFFILFFLGFVFGCNTNQALNEPYAKTILPVTIYTTNKFDEENTSIEIVNLTNDRLQGAIGINPTRIIKDLSLPQTYEKFIKFENDPDSLDIYIFHRVGIVTPDGFEEVRGTIIRNENPCDSILIISSDIGNYDTLAHEFGHLFGLEHTNDRNNIMNIDRHWTARFTAKQLRVIETRSNMFHTCYQE